LARAPFPEKGECPRDKEAEAKMKFLQDLVVEVRTIRAENRIPPKEKVKLWLRGKRDEEKELIQKHQAYIQTLANISEIKIWDKFPLQKKLLKGVVGSWEVVLPLEGIFNLEQEKMRLEKELSKIILEIEKIERRFQDANFLSRAPKEVIEETKNRLQELQTRKTKTEESLGQIISLI
jgi:valyl-tRNA synthetase